MEALREKLDTPEFTMREINRLVVVRDLVHLIDHRKENKERQRKKGKDRIR